MENGINQQIEFLATDIRETNPSRIASTFRDGGGWSFRVVHADKTIREVPEIQIWCTDGSLRLLRLMSGEVLTGQYTPPKYQMLTKFVHCTVDRRDEREDDEVQLRDHNNRIYRVGMAHLDPPYDRPLIFLVSYV